MKKICSIFVVSFALLLLPSTAHAPSSLTSGAMHQGMPASKFDAKQLIAPLVAEADALLTCPIGGILITLEDPIYKEHEFQPGSEVCFLNRTGVTMMIKEDCWDDTCWHVLLDGQSLVLIVPNDDVVHVYISYH